MTVYLGNAFSLQMVEPPTFFMQTAATQETVAHALKTNPHIIKVVGHQETADILSEMLGVEIPRNRQSIVMKPGDTLYVAQVVGGRLPEGSTTLPPGVKIEFRRVDVIGRECPDEEEEG